MKRRQSRNCFTIYINQQKNMSVSPNLATHYADFIFHRSLASTKMGKNKEAPMIQSVLPASIVRRKQSCHQSHLAVFYTVYLCRIFSQALTGRLKIPISVLDGLFVGYSFTVIFCHPCGRQKQIAKSKHLPSRRNLDRPSIIRQCPSVQ